MPGYRSPHNADYLHFERSFNNSFNSVVECVEQFFVLPSTGCPVLFPFSLRSALYEVVSVGYYVENTIALQQNSNCQRY